MTAGSDNDDYEHKFYWSFYELNNRKIIVLNHTEYWENDKLIDNEFSYSYGCSELKNGEILKYEFGDAKPSDANAMSKEFFNFFDSLPTIKDLKFLRYPTKKEEKCVEAFYKKKIMAEKDKKTNITLLKSK